MPPVDLQNSQRLYGLIRDGKLRISLQDAIALALENNLTLASFRYNFPIAQADLQRTKAGGLANGVNIAVTQTTASGFGASGGGGGSASAGNAAAGAGGIVTSTLGAGAAVPSFDPYLNFSGFVNHTVTQEANVFLVGTPILKTNNIEVLSQYQQYFPLGTELQVNYTGQRVASNSPYNVVNPELYSNFQVYLQQPLLYGFGLASNERYIHIAKRNLQTTDLAFQQQVIATVTDIENLYWDLVNAYQDVQVKTRSLEYANQTLTDDQKQLELQNIPALQVMKDQSAVATSEGDLTIAKATLRHNELLIKNDLTRTDDPSIDEIPVIPLDLQGGPDPNESKSITELIDEAMKNRPEVAIFRNQAEVLRQSLKDINSELLPATLFIRLLRRHGHRRPQKPVLQSRPGGVRHQPTHRLHQHVREHLQLLGAPVRGWRQSLHQPPQPCGQSRPVPRRARIPPKPDFPRAAAEEPSLRHPRLAVRSRAGASPRGGRAKSTRSRAEDL